MEDKLYEILEHSEIRDALKGYARNLLNRANDLYVENHEHLKNSSFLNKLFRDLHFNSTP